MYFSFITLWNFDQKAYNNIILVKISCSEATTSFLSNIWVQKSQTVYLRQVLWTQELAGQKGKTRDELQKEGAVVSFWRGRTKAEGLWEWGMQGLQAQK